MLVDYIPEFLVVVEAVFCNWRVRMSLGLLSPLITNLEGA